MRIFLALFVIFAFVGCGADNPIQPGQPGSTDVAPSRIPLAPDESDGDTAADAELQLPPARFENPLATFDFNTLIDGEPDLEPSEILDPEGTETLPDDADTGDGDDPDDDLEPEVIPDDEPDSGDGPDPDDDSPEVVTGDDSDDVDEFGIEVVE